MASKKHNPGCPCCDEISSSSSSSIYNCECTGSPGFFSRAFAGTPTLRTVIAGLPSTLDIDTQLFTPTFNREEFAISISGLSSANGTYLQPMPVTLGGCIGSVLSNVSIPISATFTMSREIFNFGNNTCTPDFVINSEGSVNLGLLLIFDSLPDSITCVVSAAVPSHWALSGTQILECVHDYDAAMHSGTASTGVSGFSPLIYSPSQGAVWNCQRNVSTDTCIPLASYQLDQLGTISAEVIDDV